MFETLLLNILFLIFPLLLFVIFFENRRPVYSNSFLITFSSISMILCMLYPIHLQIGFIFDLRYIPFIIVALYGGYKKVLPLYILLNIYRFIIGGEGTIHSLIFSTVIFLVVPLISKKFLKYSTQKRVITGVFAVLFTMGLYLLSLSTFFVHLTNEFWQLAFYSVSTHVLVITLNLLMIEKVISNIKSRENFLHTERLHVMSEISASVSHEIRNPLTVTHGFLQLLKESKTLSTDEKVYIDFSLKELERAEGIVSNFLAFAKPQSENMVSSNLKEEIEYVKNILFPYAKMNHVDIEFQFNNTLKKRYDKNQMQQSLINLLKNGIEAMKESGGILSIDVSEQNRSIIIIIKDNGIGMTEDEISQLGKPYYSTKKEGTGLGMLMVYGAISKAKGTIEVESEKGKGTTFTITLPV
ncbi:ATP-binding protein [Paenisporosarcina sp. TG-14]|uniref:ATP-binding protein n=1 Tax=Paenisporosarcina sp. TG-14 TaxID=1231057 RepID=UPI0002E40F30|nr:sensor histidine kinase [Paenisporosarcina sp. TG-14]